MPSCTLLDRNCNRGPQSRLLPPAGERYGSQPRTTTQTPNPDPGLTIAFPYSGNSFTSLLARSAVSLSLNETKAWPRIRTLWWATTGPTGR